MSCRTVRIKRIRLFSFLTDTHICFVCWLSTGHVCFYSLDVRAQTISVHVERAKAIFRERRARRRRFFDRRLRLFGLCASSNRTCQTQPVTYRRCLRPKRKTDLVGKNTWHELRMFFEPNAAKNNITRRVLAVGSNNEK